MKRFLTIILLLVMICANAQENIHYQWMDFYGKNLGTDRKAFNPRKIDLPSVDGFNAYTADLHMHTIYSDAQVTPEMRVYEAYLEGLDILAITDHHDLLAIWFMIKSRIAVPHSKKRKAYFSEIPAAEIRDVPAQAVIFNFRTLLTLCRPILRSPVRPNRKIKTCFIT